MAVLVLALMLTLLSLAGPAPGPMVPSADAQGASQWRFRVELTIPWRDTDGDGLNDYASAMPAISSKIRGSAPAFLCVRSVTPSVRQPPNNNGIWARGERNMADGCGVTAALPATFSAGDVTLTLVPNSVRHTVPSHGQYHSNAIYTDGQTSFDPMVTLTVPDAVPAQARGTDLAVTFRKTATSPDACNPNPVTNRQAWRVTNAGQVERAPSVHDRGLIDSPGGTSDTCTYDVIWPDIAGFAKPPARTISASAPTATGAYTLGLWQSEIGLDLTRITPPAARNSSYDITYEHADVSPAACKAMPVLRDRWSINADGVATAPSAPAMLGSTTSFCTYEVVWPDIPGLLKPTGDRPVISSISRVAHGVYTLDVAGAPAGTWTHEIEITLPFRDANNDGINDYNPSFDFTVTPRKDTHKPAGTVCPTAWAGGDAPAPSLGVRLRLSSEPAQTLIDNARIAGLAQKCKLRTNFPDSIASGVSGIMLDGLVDVPDRGVEFDSYEKFTAGDDDEQDDGDLLDGIHKAMVTYEDDRGSRSPGVTFNLPSPLPHGALGRQFSVTFEPQVGRCRGHPDDHREDWHITIDGRLARVGDRAYLMIWPHEGRFDQPNTYCRYDVVWPDIPGLTKPANPTLVFQRSGQNISGAVTGTYTVPPVHASTTYYNNTFRDPFALRLHITDGVPAGTRFSVTISPQPGSHVGCDANPDGSGTSKTYLLLAPASAHSTASITFTESGRHLVRRPHGASSDCVYDVTFPESEDGLTDNYIRDPSYNSRRAIVGVDCSSRRCSTHGSPQDRYTPNPNRAAVKIELPEGHRGDDLTFRVHVRKTSESHSNCTDDHHADVTFDTQNALFAETPLDVSWRVAGAATTCAYDLEFPSSATKSSSELTWIPDPRAANQTVSTITNERRVGTRHYTADTFYDATLEVHTVENVAQDTTFSIVDVTPSAVRDFSDFSADCSDLADLALTIRAGTRSATLSLPNLLAVPVRSVNTVSCHYDLTFAPHEDGLAGLYAVDTSYGDANSRITQTDTTARVRYIANPSPTTFFDGTIEVLVAQNVSDDTTFTASVTSASGAPSGCAESPNLSTDLSVMVAANTNQATLPLPQLYDQIAGAAEPCSYEVTFEANEQGGTTVYQIDPRYAAPITAISNVAGASTTARQRYTANTFFDGELTISTVENVPEDTTFTVDVERATGQPADCLGRTGVVVTLLAGTSSGTASVPEITQRVAGEATDCAYVADFPTHEDGFLAIYIEDATFSTGTTAITPAAATAETRYTLNPAPSPNLAASVEVLLTEVVSVDTSFTVSIAAAANAHEACLGLTDLSVTVPAGSQSATLAVTDLLELPLGETNPCAYVAMYAPDVLGEDAHWYLDAAHAAVTDITQAAPAASHRYAPRVWLYPRTGPNAARVLVWIVEDIPRTANFEATITAASTPDGCGTYATPQVTTFTLTVPASWWVETPAAATFADDQRLVRRPQGATTDCTYTVTFASEEVGGLSYYELDTAFGNIDADITPSSRDAQHRYHLSGVSIHWTLHIRLVVPFRDDDGDGANDYDPQFELGIERLNTFIWAHGACPDVVWRAPRLRAERGSETVAYARVAGLAPECRVHVHLRPPTASGVEGIELRRAPGTTNSESRVQSDGDLVVQYFDGRTSFQPELTINLPDPVPTAAVDESFVVRFTPTDDSPAGCGVHPDDDHEDWSVTAAGAQRDAGSRATLVGVPAGTTATCSYEIAWPPLAGLTTPATSTLAYSTTDVEGSIAVVATYEAGRPALPFMPTPTVNLPAVDYDGDGAHDYVGAQFTVTYSLKSGEPGGCTQENVEATYAVGATITAGAATYAVVGAAPSLTNTPMNSSHRCTYDLAFGETVATATAPDVALLTKLADATDDNDVSAAANDAQATYGTVARSHEVAFTADVEAAAAGQTFTVTVSAVSPPQVSDVFASCTGVARDAGTGTVAASNFDVTLTVDAAGVARGTHDLVEWPAGHGAGADRCIYEVTWPLTEDGATTVYRRTGEATSAVDADVFAQAAPTVSNAYTSAATRFDATLRLVTAPGVPAGSTFSVTVARRMGAHRGCSGGDTLIFAAAAPHADGTSDVATTLPVNGLVDRPTGTVERCSYDITWQPNTSGAVHFVEDISFAERSVTLGAATEATKTAVGRYVNAASTFDATLRLVTAPGVPGGTTFSVTVAPAPGAHDDCSGGDTVIFTTAAPHADGTSDVAITLPMAGLVDRPARSTEAERCTYDVIWSPNTSGDVHYIEDTSYADRSVTLGAATEVDKTAAARFHPDPSQQPPMVEPPAVEPPQDDPADDVPPDGVLPDDPADNEPPQDVPPDVPSPQPPTATTFDATLRLLTAPEVPSGTTFSVAIAPVSGAHGECSTPLAVTIAAAAAPGGSSGAANSGGASGGQGGVGSTDGEAIETVAGLVDLPAGATAAERCTYDVIWSPNTSGDVHFVEDMNFVDRSVALGAATEFDKTAAARFHPDPNQSPPMVEPPAVEPPAVEPPAVEPQQGDPPDDEQPGDPADDEPPDDPTNDGTTQQPPTVTTPNDPAGGNGNTGGTPTVNTPTPTGGTPTDGTPSGGTTRPTTTGGNTGGTRRTVSGGGGGGGGSRSSGGGSAAGSSGGASTGPWLVAASSRVPASVSVTTAPEALPVAGAIEVMLNVPGTCGDDLGAFAGIPAEVGVVYAQVAQPGATVDVLAHGALRLPAYEERGDQTRGCELRVTLISAPAGCRLQSADGDANTDEAGRSYVDATGSADLANFTLTPTLTCTP